LNAKKQHMWQGFLFQIPQSGSLAKISSID
jgi:hypothetical protein